jgi:hypothetical protein
VRAALYILLAICWAASPAHAQTDALNINMMTAEKSVVFIYGINNTGGVGEAAATGFLFTVPSSSKEGSYLMLVTARHVFDPIWAGCGGVQPQSFYIRLNDKKSGKAVFFPLPIYERGNAIWRHPEDETVDAALVPLKPEVLNFDVNAIAASEVPTPEERANLSIGSAIASPGLLPGYQGAERNIAVFKFGYISAKPLEPLKFHCVEGGPEHLVNEWLAGMNQVGGSSGSPVFYVPPGGSGVKFGQTRPMLIGIQSNSLLGADVAGVTPIEPIIGAVRKMEAEERALGLIKD